MTNLECTPHTHNRAYHCVEQHLFYAPSDMWQVSWNVERGDQGICRHVGQWLGCAIAKVTPEREMALEPTLPAPRAGCRGCGSI